MSSSSSRRSRFQVQVSDADPIAADSVTREYEADLESMTAKGIKRLCSELMELKKTSDEDFQRNVYLSYSAFARIFEEIGGVRSEILELKKHASTQTKLIQAVSSNVYAHMVIIGSKETEVDYPDLSLPDGFGIHMQDSLATLDILLSECRLEEALVVLEMEILTLQKLQIQEDGSSPITLSYAHALSKRSIALADQLASMAEHPRVTQPELLKSLCGLCRLGENHRANSILIKFYRSRLRKKVHELQCLKSCLYGTYIREVAKAVFSSISQAAKCFATLSGETCPYCSELILWAREETETFSHNFCTYIRSISEMSGGLSLAAEAANSSVSLCSLLKSQRVVLPSNLVDLIRPCMEEVVQTHMDHFKKDVHIFTTTDDWTLGKFLLTGQLRDKLPLTGIGEKVEYCLLSSSGRKFVALTQAIVDDISPLVILGMESSILNGLADLFSEYMSALERAIPNRGKADNGSPNVSSAQTLEQQVSVLVNASTLARVFTRIAGSIFKGTKSSNNILSEQTENFSENELGDWILAIEEVIDQLCCYFCMQFVSGIMSCGDLESTACFSDWCIPSSSPDPMPSFALQALLVRLRQLERLSESLFVGEDGMMEKLPKEIVEVAIDWLSNNQDFWSNTVESSCIRHCSFLAQVCLDMYFLVEIAAVGGYCSDDLLDAAMHLIEEMEAVATRTGSYSYGVLPGGDCAQNAAKLAIKKLLKADNVNLEPKLEAKAITLELRIQNREDEYPSCVEDSIALVDSESENSVDDGVTRLIEIKDMVPKSFDVQMSDDDYVDDDDGSRSPTVPYSDRRGGEDADRASNGTDGLSEGDDLGELGLERLAIKAEVQSVEHYADLDEIIENSKLRGREDIEEIAERLITNHDGHSVGRLDESDAIATQLTIEEQQNVSKKEIVVMVNGHEAVMFKERECKLEVTKEEDIAYPVTKSVDNLQESCGQPATDEMLEIPEKENVLQKTELIKADWLTQVEGMEDLEVEGLSTCQLESVDKLFGSDVIIAEAGVQEPKYNTEKSKILVDGELINESDVRISVEVDNNLDDLVDSTRHHAEKNLILNSLTLSKELVQVNRSNVDAEPTLLERHSVDAKDLHGDFSSSILTKLLQKCRRDGVAPVGDHENTSNGPLGHGLVRKQHVVNSRMNSKASSELGAKTSSNVKSSDAGKSKLEIEPDIVEMQRIEDRNKLLPDDISQLVLISTTPQKQRKDGAIIVEGSANDSGCSPRLRVVVKKQSKTAVRNEKGSYHSDSKISFEKGNPSKVLIKSLKLDIEKKLVMHDNHNTENKITFLGIDDVVRVDGSPVQDENSMRISLKNEEEEKLLSDKLSELAIEISSKPAGGDGNTSEDLARQRNGRKRAKSIVDENLVKSGKVAKALRRRWH